jgi:5-methylcytosine-specific restriction endonuclease McrA
MFDIPWIKSKYLRYANRSSSWSKIRKQHIENHPCCAACGRTSKLEVHHIEPVHLSPEKELDLDNLITLCDSPCHIVFGHLMNYKSWNPNVVIDCANYLKKINNRPNK